MGVIGASTAIGVIVGSTVALFFVTPLFVSGAGCLIPWSEHRQAFLGSVSLVAFTVAELTVASADAHAWLRWFGLLMAVSIGQVAAHAAQRYRGCMDAQCQAPNDGERRLRREIADRERAEAKAGEREAPLKRIFETSPDIVAVSRFRDSCTVAMRQRSGAVSPFLVSESVAELDDEQCAISIARDIADLKRTRDELMAVREQALGASRIKSEFLSSISHEIRTPMNAILGMAEVLQETALDSDQRRYLDTMLSNGAALLSLIDNILDVAKVESGRIRLEVGEFDLSEVVEKTVETLAIRAHGKGLELAARIVPGTPTRLLGDPLRLRQILGELLGNAIKFTEIGDVILTVDRAEQASSGTLRFSVSDTGIGIEPGQLATIFASFTQADSSNTRKYGGSGLGLAIASRLVGLMEGRMHVESEPGGGSIFSFAARFELPSGAGAGQTSPVQHDLGGLHALVADRNPINRLILRETLHQYGAQVTEDGSTAQAMEILGRSEFAPCPFDIVFVDCHMSVFGQIEKLMKENGGKPGAAMVVAMITTDDVNSKRARLRRMGLQHHLLKPVRRSDLLDLIKHAEVALKGSSSTAAAVQSEAPGRGGGPSLPLAGPSTPRTLRILLAEDSPDNRLLISAYFNRQPHRVDTAENGQEAIDKFASSHYDLVLMDIQMPVMDGYTAARLIREFEKRHHRRHVPILALTASALDDDINRAFEAGCTAHIAKPVRKAALFEAINAALGITGASPPETGPSATAGVPPSGSEAKTEPQRRHASTPPRGLPC